jgi:RimJ/RimL family protein N-acetyltransferase
MLRDIREEDLQTLFEQQSAPEACRMAAFIPRERDAFMLHWRTILADSSLQKKAIVIGDDVVGNVCSWGTSQRLVGYWLGQEYWGRGLATAALSEFLCEERSRPLFAHVAVHNRGSVRVLEKCGFRPVGNSQMGPDGVEEYLFELQG